LDFWEIQDAILALKKGKKYIDVIEVRTILIVSQGKKAIKALVEEFLDKIIVADGKITDAGKIFGKMFFKNKNKFTTCICAAEIPTIKDTMEIAKTFSP
ncbi:orotidine 5'-phosphate decarboxylase / HUMPS family protein, partial [Mycoplasmopsis synoviae]